MTATKWWKCDLQVATPAWDFKFPAESNYKLNDVDRTVSADERVRFLDDYMKALKEKGVNVIALADHNTGEWIDDAKSAGERHGVIVFPGCEVTTGTGADGVHLVVIGDRTKTSKDFDRLIHGPFGFDDGENPRYRTEGGKVKPLSSPKTLNQLLDSLPEDYLVIAPHTFTDNGLLSADTARGDIRFKALHHERLGAIDAGDCAMPLGDKWKARFQRRELHDFPRLKSMAFVSTSDAYSMAEFGTRFTWIRMAEPTIEALRQAFLDHESRILCDWSPNLEKFPERNPNNVRHAWISSLSLGGELGNSKVPLELSFHPGLNVIVGGRGSGKSSVVAAIRQLYSSTSTLPQRLKDDAEDFAQTVFSKATLRATHRIQESQSEQAAQWTLATKSLTNFDGQEVPTTFSATVISQKELFERAAGDKSDPELTSRSLLTLVDSGLGTPLSWAQAWGADGGQGIAATTVSQTFASLVDDARAKWVAETRSHNRLIADQEQLSALQSQLKVLEQQVQAFSAPEVRERLNRINSRQHERAEFGMLRGLFSQPLQALENLVSELALHPFTDGKEATHSPYTEVMSKLDDLRLGLQSSLSQTIDTAKANLVDFDSFTASSEWQRQLDAAEVDLQLYKQELDEKGLSPNEFSRLQDELNRTRESVRSLEEGREKVVEAGVKSFAAWQELTKLFVHRQIARSGLLRQVEGRSGRLRFNTTQFRDVGPWISFLRNTATLRDGGYVNDVENLAAWLWLGPEGTQPERFVLWQDFLTKKELKRFQEACAVKNKAFFERLANIDESARYRLAAELPEDVISMEFLKEGGKAAANGDWQPVVRGSPGQRTAAMLAFVLHHGREPLVLDQPEDDLDSEWIFNLVVKELRQSRWHRQLIVVSHNANIPVLGDAEQVIALENSEGTLRIRRSEVADPTGQAIEVLHVGPVETPYVRRDIQSIMEGGVAAFVLREQKYNNETRAHKTV